MNSSISVVRCDYFLVQRSEEILPLFIYHHHRVKSEIAFLYFYNFRHVRHFSWSVSRRNESKSLSPQFLRLRKKKVKLSRIDGDGALSAAASCFHVCPTWKSSSVPTGLMNFPGMLSIKRKQSGERRAHFDGNKSSVSASITEPLIKLRQ